MNRCILFNLPYLSKSIGVNQNTSIRFRIRKIECVFICTIAF